MQHPVFLVGLFWEPQPLVDPIGWKMPQDATNLKNTSYFLYSRMNYTPVYLLSNFDPSVVSFPHTFY